MVDIDPHPRLLLVEGQDDKHVVRHIVEACGLATEVRITEAEGVGKLLDAIPSQASVRGRKVLGVVVDANGDPTARWEALTKRFQESQPLQEAGITLPQQPRPQGIVQAERSRCPRIGIWMMPDNIRPGELEDFVKEMIPSHDPVWPSAEGYIDALPQPRRFQPEKTEKAKVHAWLATRKEPGRMGAAIGAGDLDVNSESCQTFVNWLRKLFQ